MPICGPKVALFGVILSAWGVVQLAVTGLLFHVRSVALIEDVGLGPDGSYQTPEALSTDIDVKYGAGALNCWIAALLYLATLCFSAQQFYQASI